jgi:hypothetical protein
MNKYHLQSQQESIKLLSLLFDTKPFSAKLEVCEEICFGVDNWLNIGEINLHPGSMEPGDENHYAPIERALKMGTYTWKIPQFNDLLSTTLDLMVSNEETDNEKAKQQTPQQQKEKLTPKTKRALEVIVNVAIRCGLAHPVFDAACVMEMPFKRATTVVADTNAVLQGGLDFVVRFLYPMARIKMPAVVHMEILNMADRYFSQRRAKKIPNKGSLLFDHVESQGGQRVILRLELQTDAEIDRPRVGADPLRGIFQPTQDQEDKNLGLPVIQRSFADRLILETAIEHRKRLSADHTVMLLTSDQGLAKMTLGEGMQVLFFDTNHLHDLFGSVLSGTCFRPFVGSLNAEWLYFVPLTELIWEFAFTFGSARLRNQETGAIFEVSAIGEGRPWVPYQSKDDLLWVRGEKLGSDKDERNKQGDSTHAVKNAKSKSLNTLSKDNSSTLALGHAKSVLRTSKFSLSSMLYLISHFHEKIRLTDKESQSILGITSVTYYVNYRNFLLAGGFLESQKQFFTKTERLDKLWEALKKSDYSLIKELLCGVPPFAEFVDNLKMRHPLTSEEASFINPSAFSTYCALAEISCVGLQIAGEGAYATPFIPELKAFSKIAKTTYQKLVKSDPYVLTGLWLETLAKEHGIHPIVARDCLNEAQKAGLLERYTEGSTPETQFEKHTMHVLTLENGVPVIQKIKLYHGDFVMPDRASISIKIEDK